MRGGEDEKEWKGRLKEEGKGKGKMLKGEGRLRKRSGRGGYS